MMNSQGEAMTEQYSAEDFDRIAALAEAWSRSTMTREAELTIIALRWAAERCREDAAYDKAWSEVVAKPDAGRENVAQRIEQPPSKRQVEGSNPSVPTTSHDSVSATDLPGYTLYTSYRP